jgi:hypothetical protein
MTVFHWIGLGLLAVALGFLMRSDLRFAAGRRARAQGAITGYRRSLDDGSEWFIAQVRFATASGAVIDFEDTLGKGQPEPPPGARVPVIYPVDEPAKARVERTWLRPAIYALLLAMLALLAASGLELIH